jgi:hypothetical protein
VPTSWACRFVEEGFLAFEADFRAVEADFVAFETDFLAFVEDLPALTFELILCSLRYLRWLRRVAPHRSVRPPTIHKIGRARQRHREIICE